MDLLYYTSQFSTLRFFCPRLSLHAPLRRRIFTVRSSLPFPNEKAKYHRELEAAVDVYLSYDLFNSSNNVENRRYSTILNFCMASGAACGAPVSPGFRREVA